LPLVSAEPVRATSGQEPNLLLLGASFERPSIFRYLPGSRRTILYPAIMDKEGWITPCDKPQTDKDWDRFLRNSKERISLLLATSDIQMTRDNRGVIQMALITGENPEIASCALLPGFLDRFSAVFGPEILIAIPARNKIYVFPKLANRIQDTLRTIHDDRLITPTPVSMELFELSKRGLRAVGTLEPDDD
jgi:hypothetical protein